MTELPDAMLSPGTVTSRSLRPLEIFPAVRWNGLSAVVSLPARIDDAAAGQVRDALLAIINRGIDLVMIDLSTTVYLSPAGALAIARARRRAAAADVRIQILAPECAQVIQLREQIRDQPPVPSSAVPGTIFVTGQPSGTTSGRVLGAC
ncbi:MAG: STAS domain-containing protein [Streptosporangiaceae bacterium]